MVNKSLGYKVKLIRAPVHTIELCSIIANKQGRSMHMVVADAVEYYFDNYVAIKKICNIKEK